MKKQIRFEFWKSTKPGPRIGQWLWHARAKNGEIIAQGESYKQRAGVMKLYHALFSAEKPVMVDLNQEAVARFFGKKPKHFEGKINRNWP